MSTYNEERKRALRQRTKAFASMVVRQFRKLDLRQDDIRILGKQ